MVNHWFTRSRRRKDTEAERAQPPSPAQRAYLERGLGQPGGKLPLFGPDGAAVHTATVRACIERGWAERWFENPVKPDWLVCRLTPEGYRLLGAEPRKI